MKTKTVFGSSVLLGAMFIVPYAMVTMFGGKPHLIIPPVRVHTASPPSISAAQAMAALQSGPHINVYMTETGTTQDMPLELYVARVVAGEMPVSFEPAALQAQAVCARTNAVRALHTHSAPALAAAAATGAVITDDYHYDQAYASEAVLRRQWRVNYTSNWDKIAKAVAQTRGKVLAYEGEPIQAFFFSTSSGYTQDAKDYWGQDIPYLRAVPSPWDKVAPHYQGTQVMSLNQIYDKLHIDSLNTSAGDGNSSIRVLKETDTHHVTAVQAGDKVLTGKDFRLALGLASTDFTMQRDGSNVIFRTVGYGHDVGLSQYGANGLAKEGKTAEQILAYYYQGVTMSSAQSFIPS